MKEFKIRASAASKIVTGVIGLGKGDSDHLKGCNGRRKAHEAKLKELQIALDTLHKTKPELPPEIVLKSATGLTTKEITAQEKAVQGRAKKVATIEARHKKQIELAKNRLEKLQEKGALTTNQDEKEKAILVKQANPMNLLPAGLKTYCEKWLKEWLYMRRKGFTSKQTDKGNLVEVDAIAYINEQLKLVFAKKNEQHFYDEFMQGTPDIILPFWLIDAKGSWDFDTFPLFEPVLDTDYFWQGQVYMHLTGRKKYTVAYCLMDMPEKLLEKMANQEFYSVANEDKTWDEIHEKLLQRYSFSGLPDELRFKTYHFEYEPECIELLVERVKLCRQYIKEVLLPQVSKETIMAIESYTRAFRAA